MTKIKGKIKTNVTKIVFKKKDVEIIVKIYGLFPLVLGNFLSHWEHGLACSDKTGQRQNQVWFYTFPIT